MSQWQKKSSSGLYGAREDIRGSEADTPTIQLGATPSGLISDPPPSYPHFYTGYPSCHNPPNLSWLGTGTKYAGLHTQWLGLSLSISQSWIPEAVFFLLGPSESLSVDSRLRPAAGSAVFRNSSTGVLLPAFSDEAKHIINTARFIINIQQILKMLPVLECNRITDWWYKLMHVVLTITLLTLY